MLWGGVSMRINRVIIKNYRNLRDVDIELENIVTLIGENNGGKSNFLKAISIPLSSDDGSSSKKLSWYDINKDAKNEYIQFIMNNTQSIIDGSLTEDAFSAKIPIVDIILYFLPDDNEHYNVKDILIDIHKWIGAIHYRFYIKNTLKLLSQVKDIIVNNNDLSKIQMSLLPIDLYESSLTVPIKETKIPYDTLSQFCSVYLPAERDNFASNADKLGSKILSDMFNNALSVQSHANIENAYNNFFDVIKKEGDLDNIINWQNYSDIGNAQDFFHKISVLPNMPRMSNILNNIRLGYENDFMHLQGLGYRNLILLAVLLNSYIKTQRDCYFRLVTIEEPEAHLCVSNILLSGSLIKNISQKNKYTQIVFSTHNEELVNKLGLSKVIIIHNGKVMSLNTQLKNSELDYLLTSPNTDIFKILYSRRVILVEGITEELLIKSYLQTKSELSDIKVFAFHKGYKNIIKIWKKINQNSTSKLGIVRDYDNQPNAQKEHENLQADNVLIKTTQGYTLETDITELNYELLVQNYGDEYNWTNLNKDQLQKDWREKKSDVMIKISHDLLKGKLNDFKLPNHIQDIISFMME